MIVEYGECVYRVDILEDGQIAYYKQVNGEWVIIATEEI
jgi:hypothetical protein